MASSPFITSVLLHAVIIGLVWCGAGPNKPKLPPIPRIWVDLALLPEEKATIPEAPSGAQAKEEVVPEPDGELAEAEPVDVPAPARAGLGLTEAPVGNPEIAAADVVQPVPVAAEISQAFARASYVQEGMFRSRRYAEVVAAALRKMIEAGLSAEERGALEGRTARVEASYGRGVGSRFSVSTDSKGLQKLLEDREAWSLVPPPDQYQLNYQKVTFQVSLNHGSIQVGLSPQ